MNLGAMKALVSQRLREGFGDGGPTFYPPDEISRAINEGQRLFAALTLCLEKTAAWAVPPGQTFFHMLGYIPDWLAPLRVGNAAGAKIRSARFSDLWALDPQWPSSPGAPLRYVSAGSDLFALWHQPALAGTTLTIQYAGSPAILAADTDVPEIDADRHPALVKYAVYRLRMVEGGEEFLKALPLLDAFLAAATEYAAWMRTRNQGAALDSTPMELSDYDRSDLVGSKQ